VSSYPEYRRAHVRPVGGRPSRAAEAVAVRSNAAIPVAVAVVLVGLYLGRFSLLLPGILGAVLFLSGLSFLSTRLNPLSPHFYLTRKPSWAAIGVVFLGALGLVAFAYSLWVHGGGPVVPRV
jgi:hypothetical protein